MKCDSNTSDETSMSIDSLKLRVLTLVTNTADLINERTTPTLSISHALVAPIAIFTTYFFLGLVLIGTARRQKPSFFIQVYAIVSCSAIQTTLSIIVFRDLQRSSTKAGVGQILNGVLPMLTIILLVADLTVIMFSNRDIISAPAMPTESRTPSHLHMNTEIS